MPDTKDKPAVTPTPAPAAPASAQTSASTQATPAKKSGNNTCLILLIIAGILLVCGICAMVAVGGYYWYSTMNQTDFTTDDEDIWDAIEDQLNNQDGDNTKADTDVTDDVDDGTLDGGDLNGGNGIEGGIIDGSITVPSEYIPPDLEICAIEIYTYDEYCTTEKIDDASYWPNGVGYQLEVPLGTYNVYAYDANNGMFGWYSQFVLCDLDINICDDHTLLDVEIWYDGQHEYYIDPWDWYDY